MIDTLPANQVALADAFKGLSKRRKPKRQHLADAENLMSALRERGFRLVPFPPLKARKRARRKAR